MPTANLVRVLALTNDERERHGLPPLRWNRRLARAARAHARDMDRRNYIAHDTPGGPTWWRRVGRYFGRNRTIGENVARGFDDAPSVMLAWMNSPEHRANILSRKYTMLGVGFSASDGVWVQDFGGR